jgi:enoyl-[acyl-carrier-protein] reductase (NADH)
MKTLYLLGSGKPHGEALARYLHAPARRDDQVGCGVSQYRSEACAAFGCRNQAAAGGGGRLRRLTGKDPAAEKQFTSLEPMGRMGTPEEIAEATVWLCSKAASFVTGHALAVDGGLVAQ